MTPEQLYAFVRDESQQYLAKHCASQSWETTGPATAPAFRMLIQQPKGDAAPLPKYAATAEYLHPNHCRKCLMPVEDLDEHLREHHQEFSTQAEYRGAMLSQTLAEWPQEIPPQILRSRMTAYKEALTDANFALSVCACCARQKRMCKLMPAVFPSRLNATCPSWLGWGDDDWAQYSEAWYGRRT